VSTVQHARTGRILAVPSHVVGGTCQLTVVVTSYCGANRIPRTLDSLEAQTYDAARFEVLVVTNGPDDGTEALIRTRARTSRLLIRLISTPTCGIANARNLGIHAARGEYIAWVDDDDWVSPSYVETMLRHASPQTVVLPIFGDVDGECPSAVAFSNWVNRRVLRHTGQVIPFTELATAASFDAGKVVATAIARTVPYDTELSSGLDVVYWATVFLHHGLSVTVPPLQAHAVYYRRVRVGSISRSIDEKFCSDRLLCIERLEQLKTGTRSEDRFIQVLQRGQASHLSMAAASGDRGELIHAEHPHDLAPDFQHQDLDRDSATDVVSD